MMVAKMNGWKNWSGEHRWWERGTRKTWVWMWQNWRRVAWFGDGVSVNDWSCWNGRDGWDSWDGRSSVDERSGMNDWSSVKDGSSYSRCKCDWSGEREGSGETVV